MLRSESMGCYQAIVSSELAWELINMLGELGDNMVEFIDYNKNQSLQQRTFTPFIKRCDEIQLNLTKIKQLLHQYEFNIMNCEDVEIFLEKLREYLSTRDRLEKTYIDDINEEIESFCHQIFQNSASIEQLQQKYTDLIEQSQTYLYYKDQFINSLYYQHRQEVEQKKQEQQLKISQEVEENEGRQVTLSSKPVNRKIIEKHRNEEDADWEDQYLTKQFTTVIGTIDTKDVFRFFRQLYRLTKGNFWSMHKPQLEFKERTSFILLFPVQNIQNSFLIRKINTILDVFNAKIFTSIINREDIDLKLLQIEQDKTDVSRLINLAKKKLYTELEDWSLPRNGLNCSKIIEMQLFVEKEKSIFVQLNNLQNRKLTFIGKLWCPKVYEEELLQTQVRLSLKYPHQGQAQIIECPIDEDFTPPTLFKLNAFTTPFQEIVNTYGIPRYKEINPGIYCISMFSLQFGIMFGDIGHGGFLFLFGIYLCMNHQKNPFDLKKDLNIIYELRFIILLLGFFAFYSGLIYNDFLSLPIYLFHKSCYVNQINDNGETIFVKKPDCVYPFGFDPKWYISSNELNFFNSYKMKLAVIIGVIQMSFGIILKGFNYRYFRKWVDFFFDFLPQLVFMVGTFGYMILMIVKKWSMNFEEDTSQAPSIINTMINLPLKMGQIPDEKSLWDLNLQEEIQSYILLTAIAMVPLMLFPKPIILYLQNKYSSKNNIIIKKKSSSHNNKNKNDKNMIPLELTKKMDSEEEFVQELRQSMILKEQDVQDAIQPNLNHKESYDGHEEYEQIHLLDKLHNKHEFDFSEVFVHQIIETIEFVLGSISSTASYLRLWALSLAHSQLARVFFEKTVGSGIQEGNSMQIIVGWFVFVQITVFVLMAMDLMECFLHAIRLQWVEFQGKFYKADGVKFNSFSFIGNLRAFNVEICNDKK